MCFKLFTIYLWSQRSLAPHGSFSCFTIKISAEFIWISTLLRFCTSMVAATTKVLRDSCWCKGDRGNILGFNLPRIFRGSSLSSRICLNSCLPVICNCILYVHVLFTTILWLIVNNVILYTILSLLRYHLVTVL
ncbi:hypothetical protein AAZX31_15G043900 [Glycine max]